MNRFNIGDRVKIKKEFSHANWYIEGVFTIEDITLNPKALYALTPNPWENGMGIGSEYNSIRELFLEHEITFEEYYDGNQV